MSWFQCEASLGVKTPQNYRHLPVVVKLESEKDDHVVGFIEREHFMG